jgi:hypothetical protein
MYLLCIFRPPPGDRTHTYDFVVLTFLTPPINILLVVLKTTRREKTKTRDLSAFLRNLVDHYHYEILWLIGLLEPARLRHNWFHSSAIFSLNGYLICSNAIGQLSSQLRISLFGGYSLLLILMWQVVGSSETATLRHPSLPQRNFRFQGRLRSDASWSASFREYYWLSWLQSRLTSH